MSSSNKTPLKLAASAFGSQLSRRTLFKVGGVGVAAAALASCAPSTPTAGSGASGGKTVVRMWSWYTQQQDLFPKVIKAFEDKHPSITINNRLFGTPDQYLPALQAAVSAGDVPEIFAPHTRALTYGTQGVSADLKKELGSSFLNDFFPPTNQEYTTGGKQYAVGFMAQTFGLFYNPELLAAAGVNGEPETWDDLIAAAAKINATGKSTLAFSANPTTSAGDFFLPLITQVSDDPTYFLKLDQLETGFTWDSDVVLKALQLNDKIVKAKVFQPGTTGTAGAQAEQLFYTGGAAMLFSGSWSPQDFVQNAPPEFVKKYKVMRTPAIKSGARHWTADQAGAGWSVAAGSKAKDAALEFLKFMYSAKQYSPLMNGSNSMPSTKSAAALIKNPTIQLMTSWLPDGCPHIPFGAGSAAGLEPLAKIFDQKGSPEAVAKEMQAAVLNARG